MTVEHRSRATELRATDGRKLIGYAATWSGVAKLPGFTETIRPGAFASTLASGADVMAIVDHDDSRLLARRSAGTLSLVEDERGLAFTISVPNTQLGNDTLEMVKRGDYTSMSFGFSVAPSGQVWNQTRSQRTLTSVTLAEISILTGKAPAYNATSIEARAMQAAHDAAQQRRLFVLGLL